MRYHLLATGLLLTGCISTQPPALPPDTIRVTGRATSEVKAEMVRIRVSLERTRAKADDATEAVEKGYTELQRRISKFPTERTRFRKLGSYLRQPYTSKQKFEAGIELEVVLTDPERLDQFLHAVGASGLCQFSDQEPEVADPNKYRWENRRQALLAARAKAEMMAQTLGRTLGPVQSIVEGGGQTDYFSFTCAGNNHSSSYRGIETSGLAGITDSAQVEVTFLLR